MSVHWDAVEVADLIDAFLDGTIDAWAWDDFCSITCDDPHLDQVRARCAGVRDVFPPEPGSPAYASSAGLAELQAIAAALRAGLEDP